jgi:hypothetical protein
MLNIKSLIIRVLAFLSISSKGADVTLPVILGDHVVVSDNSFKASDSTALVMSNVSFVGALFDEYFESAEIAPDAMRSYYVDYYRAEIQNGGFSQLVYNSRLKPEVLVYVREGLTAMGAKEHLQLFEKSLKVLEKLSPADLKKFLESGYFGENPERDVLNDPSDEFYALMKTHDLVRINGDWLRSLPNLTVLTIPQMQAEVRHRAAVMPNREARLAAALAQEPRYKKLIRQLSAKAGHNFKQITAGDPSHRHGGKPLIAWYFYTDKGLHYMLDVDGKALMFTSTKNQLVAEIAAPPDASNTKSE